MLVSGGLTLLDIVHKTSEIVGDGKPPFVVEGSSFSNKYGIAKLLTLSEVEDRDEGNYWLAGDQWMFVLDLAGHAGPVDTVELVNTHNGVRRNWAMKEFKVSLGDSSSGPWEEVVHQTLEDSTQQTDPLPLQTFSFPERSAKFVLFQAFSAWGDGAGLQYFAVKHIGEEKK